MQPTTNQVSGVVERMLYGLAMLVLAKAVEKKWIDSEMATYLAAGFVTAAGAVWGWWINRPKALLVAAAQDAPAGTKIVTTQELAVDTPNSPNIVSQETNKVVPK